MRHLIFERCVGGCNPRNISCKHVKEISCHQFRYLSFFGWHKKTKSTLLRRLYVVILMMNSSLITARNLECGHMRHSGVSGAEACMRHAGVFMRYVVTLNLITTRNRKCHGTLQIRIIPCVFRTWIIITIMIPISI